MGILSWIVVGLVAGFLARWIVPLILPGKEPGGIILTTLIGIAGAFVGGFVVSLFTHTDYITGINISTIIVATLGAILLLVVYHLLMAQRGAHTGSAPPGGTT
jgi:uncharacterized membrane protein YeaQ/YmgE (transglycosylase-associated protein family)